MDRIHRRRKMFCPHCHRILGKTAYYRHKLKYYNSDNDCWTEQSTNIFKPDGGNVESSTVNALDQEMLLQDESQYQEDDQDVDTLNNVSIYLVVFDACICM